MCMQSVISQENTMKSFYILPYLILYIYSFICDGAVWLLRQHSDRDTLNSSTVTNAIEC